MKKRNLVLVLLLEIITLGIYGFIFDYYFVRDLNEREKDLPAIIDVLTAVLFGIMTFNVSWLIRQYNLFKKTDKYFNSNYTKLNFVLTILFLGIVPIVIIQNQINKSENN